MTTISYGRFRDSRLERLATDHLKLDALVARSSCIRYKILRQKSKKYPPEEYQIDYHLRSIVGIDAQQRPQYGNLHSIKVQFPPGYPNEAPICKTVTKVWHPNIKWSGQKQGNVCINAGEQQGWVDLEELVLYIGELLQYKNYHAVPEEYPYPEDLEVAKWIRTYAEPEGIVDKEKQIVIDSQPLLNPISGKYMPREPLKQQSSEITMVVKRKEKKPVPPPSGNGEDIIIIRKK